MNIIDLKPPAPPRFFWKVGLRLVVCIFLLFTNTEDASATYNLDFLMCTHAT